jgi:acetyl-CoA carboxylase carboxyl transferase alpha subunit/acetyl-CoA carboxylase carboxyl transferase beta subunit
MTTTQAPPEPRSAEEWIQILFDPASFDEQFTGVRTPDPLKFSDSRPYSDRIAAAREKTGRREAVWTGVAWLGGFRVVAAVSDFRFIGGTMGFAVGERVAEAMEQARKAKIPFVAVTCSGGARMQEGVVALFQMAKTAAAAQRLHEAGVPMITVLASPTTGGVYASYATQADLIVAEDGAVIGFAGGRVRAVRTTEDEDETLHAQDLFDAGQVDAVLPSEGIRPFLIRAVRMMSKSSPPAKDAVPPPVPLGSPSSGWDAVQMARHPERPRAGQYLVMMLADFIPIRGDRAGTDDPALTAGFGRIDEINIVCVAQDRKHGDGRVTPAGYRKARRAMQIANRLGLPLVTLVDTPGASDSLADEINGLAGSISDCLATMAAATNPTVSAVIGEGGSGGALALSVADRLLMQQNAIYAVTSPEGAAAILYRDRDRAPEVADHLGITASDLKRLGVIDTIVPEPAGGAHTEPRAAANMLAQELKRALAQSMRGRGSARRRQREKRLQRLGRTRFGPLRDAADLLAGVSELAVHALDSGRQLLGIRPRGNGNESSDDR